MIQVADRVPTKPNRIKLTDETTGEIKYYVWERADEPTVPGTPINKALFDSIGQDMEELADNIGSTIVVQNLAVSSWTGSSAPFYITFTLNGYDPNTKVVQVAPTAAGDMDEWGKAGLWFEGSGTNVIKVTARNQKPTKNISVTLEVRDKK